MRRTDTKKCSAGPSVAHSWIDITKNEDRNQGLRRYACAACGINTMEKDPDASEAPRKL